MHDENPHLRTIFRGNSAEPAEDDSDLPSLREGEYQPYARAANKPIYSIHFVNPKGDVRSFQYVHLDSDSSFTAESITLKFMGMRPIKIVIEGRNLWRLYDYIHQHRMNWIMQAARGFAKDGQPIVTGVTFSGINDEE